MITIGSSFTFSLDSRVGKATLPRNKQRKSPSTLKRNAKRREEFLTKKSTSTSVVTGLESYEKPKKQNGYFQCDQCDVNFKTMNGLKIHKGNSQKEASPQEKLKESSSQSSLSLSVPNKGPEQKGHNIYTYTYIILILYLYYTYIYNIYT